MTITTTGKVSVWLKRAAVGVICVVALTGLASCGDAGHTAHVGQSTTQSAAGDTADGAASDQSTSTDDDAAADSGTADDQDTHADHTDHTDHAHHDSQSSDDQSSDSTGDDTTSAIDAATSYDHSCC